MGVVVCYAPNGSDLDALRDKCKAAAAKVCLLYTSDTVTYKKLIAGVLVTLQKQVFEYLELLDGGKYTHAQLEEIIRFTADFMLPQTGYQGSGRCRSG